MTKAVKKFTRKLLKSDKATDIISWIISKYLKIVGHTTRWQIEGLEAMNKTWDKEGSMIILSWHPYVVSIYILLTAVLNPYTISNCCHSE